MKKLLIIGTGFGQLPMVEYCKQNNIYSIGVDINENSLGACIVDKFYKLDVTDIEGIIRVALENEIDGVSTMQSDLTVPAVGAVNDKMGLCGISYETALVCSNKNQTRNRLLERGVTQPEFINCINLEEAKNAVKSIGVPCVIKASDSSGSRGVTKVEDLLSVTDAFDEAKKYSRNNIVVVEKFIDGIEIGAQSFSQNGNCIYLLPHNDLLSDNGYMVPVGHSYPLSLENFNESEFIEDIEKTLSALEVHDGPSNIDLIIDDTGKAYVIEVGARIGATCLPELSSIYAGFDWVEITVQRALGIEIAVKQLSKTPCAALILEAKADGILKQTKFLDSIKEYEKYEPDIEITVDKGDEVRILRKGTDRIGKVVAQANSLSEVEEVVKKIKNKIVFEIE